MTSERWQRIEQIYNATRERDPRERSAYVAAACGGDAALAREVTSLLAADNDAGHFLSSAELDEQLRALALDEPAEALGPKLGHYEILSLLGRGGMAEVYLARDTRLGRRVALKLLSSRLLGDERNLARFLQEAKAASALNHPNITTIYEVGLERGLHFISMEYVEGVTLRALLRNPIPPAEAARITIEAASALAAAHSAGIVHRDIKPENIMIRKDHAVKLLDFGLARMTASAEMATSLAGSVAHTEAGILVGTPRYMSPEQARGKATDARTDTFSLGAVLYEMLTAEPPFAGETTADLFAALLDHEPEPLRDLPNRVAKQFEPVLKKALAKSPEQRYQTIQEMADDLRGIETKLQTGRRTFGFHLTPRVTRIAVSLIVVAALALGWRKMPALRAPVDEALVAKPFTSFPGAKEGGSFSPDGSQIAFAWTGPSPDPKGSEHIFIKVVGAGEPLQLTNSAGSDSVPDWSPDGRWIAFNRNVAGKDYVYVIPALGGAERNLGEAGRGVSWSPDGKTLVCAGPQQASLPGGLVLITAATGERRELTPPRMPDSRPTFSPDGRTIAFTREISISAREIFTIPAAGGTATQLTFDKRLTFGATWTADGRELVFSSNRKVVENLWRMPARGGTPKRVPLSGQQGKFPKISRQGNQLVYTEQYRDTNIWRYAGAGFGAGGSPAPLGSPELLIASSREDDSPVFSPDGSRVAFVSTRSGSQEIWVADRNGLNAVPLTSYEGAPLGSPRWSPDGRLLAFDAREPGHPAIYFVGLDGKPPRQVTLDQANNIIPSWSRDGRWLYYCSGRSGAYEVWKMPAGGGEAIQMTRSGGFDSYESPDGKLLYFVKGGNVPGIWSVPADGGEEKIVPELRDVAAWRAWGILPQGIYFVMREGPKKFSARFFSFSSRRITDLAILEKEPLWNLPAIALSPDGKTLLYAQRDHVTNDLMLIENFR